MKRAVASWMDGAALALASLSSSRPLEQLTFVEQISEKAEEIRTALFAYQPTPGVPALRINVTPSEPIPTKTAESVRIVTPPKSLPHLVTRLSVERHGRKYLFGSLSDQASHRQDDTDLAAETIDNANDELAAKEELERQKQAAKYLFNLVVPRSFRDEFRRKDPIVIECDNRTAQLHWELMADPEMEYKWIPGAEFLGMHPTITRQFRNSFAVPPDPPPRYDHTLRVLIVADTDAIRALNAAQEEARNIEALFHEYGQSLRAAGSNRRVSIKPLIGPEVANYDSVLQHLLSYPPYDLLHFSGHCEYVKEDPASSGWLFSKGKKITAYELTRVGCVPGFVFSNACSSGVVPSDIRYLARRAVPSFAEAFFKQGVKNFVCTAWPVASSAARDFACIFYEELLGSDGRHPGYMYEAMREARIGISRTMPSGTRTWGAYQHYGNPWFKL